MNWIKANKFLSGFLAVMLVGAGVLTFLLLSAKGKYDETSAEYEKQAAELNRLQSLSPFPDAKNLEAMAGQKGEHQQAIVTLQKNLTGNEIPIEPLAPEQFQDRLRETVSRVAAKATEARVGLPEKGTFLGFERYQTEPPKTEAAPILGRDLKAIELVVNQLIESRVAAITRVERTPITEEGGGKEPARDQRNSRPAAGGGGGGREDRGNAAPLVKKHTFEVGVQSTQSSFVGALNKIVGNKTQFLVPRLITVANAQQAGPPRVDPNAGATTPAVDPAAPTAPGTAAAAPAPARKYIVGEELVDAGLRLEIVDFVEPATK
jgi:hypothetical protein